MKKAHHLSIRARLFLLVLAVILPAAGLVAWQVAADLRDARTEAYASVRLAAQETAQDLGQLLRYNEQLLERLAARPMVRALDAKRCDPVIGEYATLHPEFTTLVVRDRTGKAICSFLANPVEQVSEREYPWFGPGIRSGAFRASDAYFGHQSGIWVSVLTYPVRDAAGAVAGLLVLPVDLRALNQRLMHAVAPQVRALVVDRQGRLLLQSGSSSLATGAPVPLPPAADAQDEAKGAVWSSSMDGVKRLYSTAAVPGVGWQVYSGVPEEHIVAGAQVRAVRSAVLGIATLMLALALAYFIASSIVKPVGELARVSSKITAGDHEARVRVGGPAELESVSRHFNRMLDVRAEQEEALRASEERLHRIVHMAAEAIIVTDAEFKVVLFNPAAEAMFDRKAEQVLGLSAECFVPERLRDGARALMARFSAGTANVIRMGEHTQLHGLRASGDEFPLELSLSKIDEAGKSLYSAVLNDLSARRKEEERLNALANYDALTALPNRAMFRQRLQRALVHAQRFNEGLGLIFVDLDRFKIINDTLGHEVGDRVLKTVAERLKISLRESDVIACLGGDEFAVLIEQVADTRFVGSVARKLLNTVSELIDVDGLEYQITASLGISTYPADGSDATTLLRNADIAMHRAKERGCNNVQFYASAMNANSMLRLSLETGLRHALERGEFVLHYQPKIAIASGRITGMEALVRWIRPGSGMVSPADFIPLAEETGLIVPIGAWVLRTACERNQRWQSEGMPPLRVAVNLSARQFQQANLVSEIARVLDASDLPPGLLELEITESMVMDNPERAIQTLRQLKSMGIALSIDDFGTGYSSLGYLKRFPIDHIKIDRAFIKDIPQNADDAIITRTIIDMAHNLRLKAIAEGVETEAQLAFLREHGCDEIQGYYFSRPLAEDAFLALVQAREASSAIAA